MAYRIMYGNTPIYDPIHGIIGLHGTKLEAKTDSVDVLSFTATPDNQIVNLYAPHDFDNPACVYFDDDLLFMGVVTRYQTLFNGEMAFRCESDLTLLKWVDVMILPNPTGVPIYDHLTAQQVFERTIAAYNEVVSPAMKFEIAQGSDLSGIGYYDQPSGKTIVDFPTKPTKALDVLSKAILKPYNCMIRTWRENGVRKVAIYTGATEQSAQVIRFGENLLDLVTEIDMENLYTGIFATGAQRRKYVGVHTNSVRLRQDTQPWPGGVLALASNTGEDIEVKKGDVIAIGDGEYTFTSEGTIKPNNTTYYTVDYNDLEALPAGTTGYVIRGNTDSTSYTLTLDNVQDGYVQDVQPDRFLKVGQVLWDMNLVSVYGYKTKVYEDSGERYSSRLLDKALAQLRFNSPQIHGISARGMDMTLYDPSKHHIQVGQTVRILSEPHGVDTTMTVTSIDLDLDNPSNSRYNMGALGKSVRSRMEDNASETEYVMDALQKDIQDTIPASMIRRLF